MYDWVTHTLSIIQGECPGKCVYCYVKTGRAKDHPSYKGWPRVNEEDMKANLGTGNTIFVCHMSDLFMKTRHGEIQSADIIRVLDRLNQFPDNTYVLQSKNPRRIMDFLDRLPPKCIIGTTIETDEVRYIHDFSAAPAPRDRADAMKEIRQWTGHKTFITIEPIIKMRPMVLAEMIVEARPTFVNIGADSKGNNLPEPTWESVQELIKRLKQNNIEIREKTNLDRLERNSLIL